MAGETPRSLRLFVAVELPDDVRSALAGSIDLLRNAGAGAGLRWVRPEAMHLTLKFLGSTPEEKLPAIEDALDEAARDVAPFVLQLAGFGSFHGGRGEIQHRGTRESYHYNLRVVWVGVQGDVEALRQLAARVEEHVAPLGFPTEKRAFSAHLTLARVRDDADRATREEMFRTLEPYLSEGTRTGNFRPELVPAFPALRVGRISLMQSTLGRGGATYASLRTFALHDAS